MKDINKPFLAVTLFALYFSFAGIFTDVAFITDKTLVPYYTYGRIIFGIINLILIILAFKKVNLDKLVIIFLITMMIYSIHGQYFVPCYYLGYMEVLYGVGMFFPIHKKIYRSIAIISAFLMVYVLMLGHSSYSTDPLLINKFKYDSISVVIIMTICSIIGHTYITLTRKEKDILYNKFIDIGKNSAFILHDFKGMLSTPIIYTKLINENIKNQDFTKASKNLISLESDLIEIEKYAKEINKITLPGERWKNEEFFLSQSIDSLKILLNKYLTNVDLILLNDQKIKADQCSLLKILYNLTINSIDQFRKNGQNDCKIMISVEDNYIIFKDNGIGYPESILKKLNTNTLSLESNTGNSGLGLQIVAGIAKELHMKLIFFNDNGAGVKIIL